MVTKETRAKWDDRIALCMARAEKMSDWEVEFMDSIELRRSLGYELSTKQVSTLYTICNKVGG